MSAQYQAITGPALLATGWTRLYEGGFAIRLGPGRELQLMKRWAAWDLLIAGTGGTMHLRCVSDLGTLQRLVEAIRGG